MSLFTKKKKLKKIPRTEESKAGGQYLMGQLEKGVPEIPVREVAGLTKTQQIINRALADLTSEVGGDADLARAEFRKTLEGGYDPRTSPYYRGLREESERLKQEGVTDIRQASELGGMFKSTPRLGAEGELVNIANSNLLKQLGLMYETERGRKTQAARDIQDVGTKEIGKYAAIGAVSDLERQLEQEVYNAKYTAAVERLIFPYREMAGIATSLLGVKEDYYMSGGGLSDLSQGLVLGGAVVGSVLNPAGGLAGMTQGGQGSAVNVAGSSFTNPQAVYGAPTGY